MCSYEQPYVQTEDQLSLLNTPATLQCSLKNSNESISIMRWQKNGTNGAGPHNVATINTRRPSIFSSYKDKINVTQQNMKTVTLEILNVTKEDSGCFICSFYSFDYDKYSNWSVFSNTTCLLVNASVETNISSSSNKHGGVNVTCLARALPPASNVTWIGASNIDNSTSVTNNSDGTLTVRSTLYVKDEEHQINRTVYCRVSHQVTVTYLVGPWNSTGDLDIFHLILQELNLSEGDLYFNDDDGGEDDDDYEDEDYEDDEKK
uniref:Glycoprotein vOX2-4 n=1 Tax=Elephant endotheliotropic herpesvirus 1A TaxID=759753 RepID=A0A866VSZ3_ELHV1|nr:glycoprotein vOX2-4 [Elephant endotheliotropic herpesvirus 1A]